MDTKTTTQKAIAGFAESRQKQADHAQSHPVRAALAAIGHLAAGFVVAGFGVFGGTKLGFPWYAVALIWVAAFFVAGPNVAKATLAFIVGAIGQALTLKKQNKDETP